MPLRCQMVRRCKPYVFIVAQIYDFVNSFVLIFGDFASFVV